MSISLVPLEVLEHIFSFLDGQSFCVSRRVCKTWNIVIKEMHKKKSYWKSFCTREIPTNVLEELLSFKTINSVWNDLDWTGVYKKWFNSRMILKSSYSKKKMVVKEKNPVTVVRLSGSWVITGHSNGRISIWDAETGDMNQSCLCHLKTVNDIALVNLLNLDLYLGLEDLPWAHHHMITISKDRYINVVCLLEPLSYFDSYERINYHTDDIKQVKVFGDIFAVRCLDNTLSLWKMKLSRNPFYTLQVTFLQKIVGPEDYLLSIGLWYDQVHCVSNSGKLKSLLVHEDLWVEERQFKSSSSDGDAELIVAVTAAFLFRQKTIIMLTSDGKIILSVDNNSCKHYHLMKTLRTGVVSIAFYGTILALGGENGKLFLYYVFSEEQIIFMDLSQPDSVLSLSEASIISIDITYENDSPVIAASTNDTIHIVKWLKPNLSHQQVKKRDLSQLFV